MGERYCIACGQDMGRAFDPPIECDGCEAHRQGYNRGRAAGIAEERARVVAHLERAGAQLSAFHAFAGGALSLEAAHIREGAHMPETGGEE